MRVASYLRVSTSQQVQHDLSLPDQERAIAEYVESKGWEVTQVFVEPGASARSDKRPVFQEMMGFALSNPPPFDIIVEGQFRGAVRRHPALRGVALA